jgi:hypothetical protein
MTDFYRQRLAHAKWTWREDRPWRQGKHPKDRDSGRHEKRRARASGRRDIEDQLLTAFDPLDDYDLCTSSCCAAYVPGLGIVRKRWNQPSSM